MQQPIYHTLVLLLLLPFLACRSDKPEQSDTTAIAVDTAIIATDMHYEPDISPMVSGHRGARFYEKYPENCLETFKYLSSKFYMIIECDVSMSADSVLFLMHDNTLDRTTTGFGKVKDQDWSYISKLHLVDDEGMLSTYKIPLLSEVLRWAPGKAILSLDIKEGVPMEKVLDMVSRHEVDPYVIVITYDIESMQKVHALNPNVMISASSRNFDELERLIQSGVPAEKLIAFTGTIRSPSSLYQRLHDLGVISIFGTFGNIDKQALSRGSHVYHELLEAGVDIIATDYPLEAKAAIEEYKKKK